MFQTNAYVGMEIVNAAKNPYSGDWTWDILCSYSDVFLTEQTCQVLIACQVLIVGYLTSFVN